MAMDFEGEFAQQPDVPNRTRQARVILENCQNDINEARVIAPTNVMFAETWENIDYWSW